MRRCLWTPLVRQMALVLACAALPRLWSACTDQGLLWPDEIYQGPEQAHRIVFGYGFVPWEFRAGARSWIYPGLLSILFKGLALVGVDDGLALMVAAKCAMVLWALVGIAFAMRLAERLAGPAGSLAAGVLLAAFPPSLAFDTRCTTEAATAPLLVAAAFFALESGDSTRWRGRDVAPWLAGGLAALASALRPQNGLVLAGLLAVLLAMRRWEACRHCAAGAALIMFAAGLLDAVTWGVPFNALVVYLRYNVIEGQSADYGVEPLFFYAQVAWTSVGPAIVGIVAGLLASGRRTAGPALVVFAFLVIHSLVPHKELRFLAPVLPLALSLSGAGIARAMKRLVLGAHGGGAPSAGAMLPAVAGVSVVLAGAMAYRAVHLTQGDMGWISRPDDPSASGRSAWHDMDGTDRLMARAGRESALCGLAIDNIYPIWTGGYSYLHRDVPYFPIPPQAFASGSVPGANYVIAGADAPHSADFVVVASAGDSRLYRRPGTCGAPPAYYTRSFE
jgi:hypothetical protein